MPRTLIKIITQRRGCANRPFYHISAQYKNRRVTEEAIEYLGSFDPMPNIKNEILVGINFERLQYYLGTGADISYPTAQLLGLCGFFPIHPRTYMYAWRAREENRKKCEQENADIEKVDGSSSTD